jgi:hypothetical protein
MEKIDRPASIPKFKDLVPLYKIKQDLDKYISGLDPQFACDFSHLTSEDYKNVY